MDLEILPLADVNFLIVLLNWETNQKKICNSCSMREITQNIIRDLLAMLPNVVIAERCCFKIA
jgi:hypothetical protein